MDNTINENYTDRNHSDRTYSDRNYADHTENVLNHRNRINNGIDDDMKTSYERDSIQRDSIQRDSIQRDSIQRDSIQKEAFEKEFNKRVEKKALAKSRVDHIQTQYLDSDLKTVINVLKREIQDPEQLEIKMKKEILQKDFIPRMNKDRLNAERLEQSHLINDQDILSFWTFAQEEKSREMDHLRMGSGASESSRTEYEHIAKKIYGIKFAG